MPFHAIDALERLRSVEAPAHCTGCHIEGTQPAIDTAFHHHIIDHRRRTREPDIRGTRWNAHFPITTAISNRRVAPAHLARGCIHSVQAGDLIGVLAIGPGKFVYGGEHTLTIECDAPV